MIAMHKYSSVGDAFTDEFCGGFKVAQKVLVAHVRDADLLQGQVGKGRGHNLRQGDKVDAQDVADLELGNELEVGRGVFVAQKKAALDFV